MTFSNRLSPNLTLEYRQSVKFDSLYSFFIFSLQSGEKLDKIELAFRKFDKNQDGFLSKEEFDVVSFTTVAQVSRGLERFREMLVFFSLQNLLKTTMIQVRHDVESRTRYSVVQKASKFTQPRGIAQGPVYDLREGNRERSRRSSNPVTIFRRTLSCRGSGSFQRKGPSHFQDRGL